MASKLVDCVRADPARPARPPPGLELGAWLRRCMVNETQLIEQARWVLENRGDDALRAYVEHIAAHRQLMSLRCEHLGVSWL